MGKNRSLRRIVRCGSRLFHRSDTTEITQAQLIHDYVYLRIYSYRQLRGCGTNCHPKLRHRLEVIMGAYDAGLVYSASRAQGRTMSQSDLAELCTTAGWVHDNAQSVCIIMQESSGKTDARSKNPDGNENIGLFQIDTVNVLHGEHLLDPVYNANVARRMWRADGGTFKKRWATAGACADKTGNVQPGDEATAVGVGAVADNVANSVQNAVSGVLNGIPWFRMGKGAFGFVLIVGGSFALIFVVANKATSTPIGKAAKKAIK